MAKPEGGCENPPDRRRRPGSKHAGRHRWQPSPGMGREIGVMVELILFIDGRRRQVTNPEISGESGFVEAAAAPAAMPMAPSPNP